MEEDSYDSMPSFEVPEQLVESSIDDDTPSQCDRADVPTVITYQVIQDGSQKGKEKLADSQGYTYIVKVRRANGNKVWRCSVRNKFMWCKATVLQKTNGHTSSPTWSGNCHKRRSISQENGSNGNLYICS
jgi:hypothetical protein